MSVTLVIKKQNELPLFYNIFFYFFSGNTTVIFFKYKTVQQLILNLLWKKNNVNAKVLFLLRPRINRVICTSSYYLKKRLAFGLKKFFFSHKRKKDHPRKKLCSVTLKRKLEKKNAYLHEVEIGSLFSVIGASKYASHQLKISKIYNKIPFFHSKGREQF